jgi:phage shock protein PspC (stress-responsive transcriptional regulator)
MAKRLYRNDSEKVIGGVCAGLAEYFAISMLLLFE